MEINLKTTKKQELIDITRKVQEIVSYSLIKEGIVVVHSMHTTAGITINENSDEDVKSDILKALSIFDRGDYSHSEGNSDAHIKTSLIGNSVTVPIESGKLILGTWQGIMFAEFDGPRKRQVKIKIIISS